jgi:hypothetical protein
VGSRTQLRMYQIAPGRLGDFVREWRSAVVPLRARFGFRVERAWTVESADTFVWIVTYDGEGSFEDANAAYYESPERKAVQPDPARHIAEAKTWMLESVVEPPRT